MDYGVIYLKISPHFDLSDITEYAKKTETYNESQRIGERGRHREPSSFYIRA